MERQRLTAVVVGFLALFTLAAQSSVYLPSTDWWSFYYEEEKALAATENGGEYQPQPRKIVAGVRHEATSPANLTILGIPLGENASIRDNDNLRRIRSRFGWVTEVSRGDGAVARQQICYEPEGPAESPKVVFEEGDLEYRFYLLAGSIRWQGSNFCAKSRFVSARTSTPSGLKLGLTREEVESILGRPSEVTRDSLIYGFSAKKRLSAKELSRFESKASPEDLKELRSFKYDYYVIIKATFRGSRMMVLAVSKDKVIW